MRFRHRRASTPRRCRRGSRPGSPPRTSSWSSRSCSLLGRSLAHWVVRAVEQGFCFPDGAAPQGPDPHRAGVEVGPVDLAGRRVDRDADRVVLGAKQGLGGARAVQVPQPNLVGELVRPIDLVVRGVDRYAARSVSAWVRKQGRGRAGAVQVADPDLVGAEVGPVDLASGWMDRDAAEVRGLGEQGRGDSPVPSRLAARISPEFQLAQ